MLTHWGCERARPGQHSANALRRLGAEVVRRAADDADHQDQDQDPARRDARPGGFVHRIGCSGCDDDDCDRRTTAAPLCPFGSDRTWEISAVRAESPAAAVAEAAADPDAAAVVAAPRCPFGADRRWEISAARAVAEPPSAQTPSPAMAAAAVASPAAATAEEWKPNLDDIADRFHTLEELGRHLVRVEASKQRGRAEREERVRNKTRELEELAEHCNVEELTCPCAPGRAWRSIFALRVHCRGVQHNAWLVEQGHQSAMDGALDRWGADVNSPTSPHAGVSWEKRRGRWKAQIRSKKRKATLGYFVDEDRAAAAYATARRAKLEGRYVTEAQAEACSSCAAGFSPVGHRRNTASTVSDHLGVCWDSERSKWMARISIDGVQKHLGYFSSEADAAASVQAAQWAKWRGMPVSGPRAVLPACDGRFHCVACWVAQKRDPRLNAYVGSTRRRLSDHMRRCKHWPPGSKCWGLKRPVQTPDGCQRFYAFCVCGQASCAAGDAWVQHPDAATWLSGMRA